MITYEKNDYLIHTKGYKAKLLSYVILEALK